VSTHTISLGDLISLFYEEYLRLYGDEDLAAIATAATINDILESEGMRVRPAHIPRLPPKDKAQA